MFLIVYKKGLQLHSCPDTFILKGSCTVNPHWSTLKPLAVRIKSAERWSEHLPVASSPDRCSSLLCLSPPASPKEEIVHREEEGRDLSPCPQESERPVGGGREGAAARPAARHKGSDKRGAQRTDQRAKKRLIRHLTTCSNIHFASDVI